MKHQPARRLTSSHSPQTSLAATQRELAQLSAGKHHADYFTPAARPTKIFPHMPEETKRLGDPPPLPTHLRRKEMLRPCLFFSLWFFFFPWRQAIPKHRLAFLPWRDIFGGVEGAPRGRQALPWHVTALLQCQWPSAAMQQDTAWLRSRARAKKKRHFVC